MCICDIFLSRIGSFFKIKFKSNIAAVFNLDNGKSKSAMIKIMRILVVCAIIFYSGIDGAFKLPPMFQKMGEFGES